MAVVRRIGELQDFLQPLYFDTPKVIALAHAFYKTFKELAAESKNQFLPTPISESLLRPSKAQEGRCDYEFFMSSILCFIVLFCAVKKIDTLCKRAPLIYVCMSFHMSRGATLG